MCQKLTSNAIDGLDLDDHGRNVLAGFAKTFPNSRLELKRHNEDTDEPRVTESISTKPLTTRPARKCWAHLTEKTMNKFGKIDTSAPHQTPVGTAVWAHLIEPNTFNDKAGVYEVHLKFPPEAQKLLAEKLDAVFETAYEWHCQNERKTLKRAQKPWKLDKDGETMLFHFRTTASGIGRDGKMWTRQPGLFDANGVPIPEEVRAKLQIGTGSQLIVVYKFGSWSTPIGAGLSLYLEAVQLIKVVDPKKDAAFYGLSKQEGWTLKPETPAEEPPAMFADLPEYRGDDEHDGHQDLTN